MNILALDLATKTGWATGKAAMIEAARDRGWTPFDDNEADAALLLEYAMAELPAAF